MNATIKRKPGRFNLTTPSRFSKPLTMVRLKSQRSVLQELWRGALARRVTNQPKPQTAVWQLRDAITTVRNALHQRPISLQPPYTMDKWLYHREQTQALLDGHPERIRPVTLEFAPCNDCNFGCPACPYKATRPKATRRGVHDPEGRHCMPLDLVERVLTQIRAFGVKSIITTGGGEPFMHPRIMDILRLEKELGFEVGVYTNGSLMTEAQAETLMRDIQPAFVRISINAIGEESHRQFHGYRRGESLFTQISARVRHLARLKMEYQSATTLGIAFIVGPRNLASLAAAGSYIKSLVFDPHGQQTGLHDYAVFRPEVRYARPDREGKAAIGEQHSSQCFADFMTLFDEHIRPETAHIPGFQAIANPMRFRQMSAGQQQACDRCLAHSLRLNLWWDGGIYLCTEHNGSPRFLIGDLKNQSMEEIWYGDRRKEVISRLDQEIFKSSCPPICVESDNNLVFDQLLRLDSRARRNLSKAIGIIQAHTPAPLHVNFI